MDDNQMRKNKYIFFINIEEQARKIYEKSYKNSEYERVKKDFVPANIMIIKKEYEKKLLDEILEFTLNLILKYNIKEPMILDLSNELNSIIEQYEGNWTQYVKTSHIYILKLKKEIERNVAKLTRNKFLGSETNEWKRIKKIYYWFNC